MDVGSGRKACLEKRGGWIVMRMMMKQEIQKFFIKTTLLCVPCDDFLGN